MVVCREEGSRVGAGTVVGDDAVGDCWAGGRVGGWITREGLRVFAHVLVSWESGSRVGAGAVGGADGVDGLGGARREGGGGDGVTADNCATVFSIRSIRSSNVIRS